MCDLGTLLTSTVTFLLAIFFGVLGLIGIPETYAATLLQRRAKKLKHQTKNWALHAKVWAMLICGSLGNLLTTYAD
jgi:DHA1 family multidrug resistance protein-like MFS transporter